MSKLLKALHIKKKAKADEADSAGGNTPPKGGPVKKSKESARARGAGDRSEPPAAHASQQLQSVRAQAAEKKPLLGAIDVGDAEASAAARIGGGGAAGGNWDSASVVLSVGTASAAVADEELMPDERTDRRLITPFAERGGSGDGGSAAPRQRVERSSKPQDFQVRPSSLSFHLI